MFNVTAKNVPRAFQEMMVKMPMVAVRQESRNGPVLSVPYPAVLTITEPRERVLFDPIRDANPFFHMMEAIWMFAGSNDVLWLTKFVKRYNDYAEPGTNIVHGAYGFRWRNEFDVEQIHLAIDLLRRNPDDRQVVLQMWGAKLDLGITKNDKPCNTHIYLRVIDNRLNMLVCNRSNDAIWGMLGANVVHMTMLQEFIASAAGLKLGVYQVVSNNLHAYPEMVKNFDQLWESHSVHDRYSHLPIPHLPILLAGEHHIHFLDACENFIANPSFTSMIGHPFLDQVVRPMYLAWEAFKRDGDYRYWLSKIEAIDWRIACEQWVNRRLTGRETKSDDTM